MLIKRRIRGILSGSTTVQWQRLWLILRLRYGLDFPAARLPSPVRRFPVRRCAMVLPAMGPDCHLVRTAIPPMSREDSLGDFHSGQTVS